MMRLIMLACKTGEQYFSPGNGGCYLTGKAGRNKGFPIATFVYPRVPEGYPEIVKLPPFGWQCEVILWPKWDFISPMEILS